MKTKTVIDDHILKEAFSFSRSRTKKEVMPEAVRELIRLRKRKDLPELAGRISFYPGYGHKALRKIR